MCFHSLIFEYIPDVVMFIAAEAQHVVREERARKQARLQDLEEYLKGLQEVKEKVAAEQAAYEPALGVAIEHEELEEEKALEKVAERRRLERESAAVVAEEAIRAEKEAEKAQNVLEKVIRKQAAQEAKEAERQAATDRRRVL
jgi:hypothetical protein